MKLRFLGTAAAEGIPALWCNCEYCRKAFAAGGKDLRHRTGYLLDDDTIIDFGPDLFSQSLAFGIDLTLIKRVLLTHLHEDHFAPMEFFYRIGGGFSKDVKPIDMISSPETFRHMLKNIGIELEQMKINPLKTYGGEWISSGDMEIFGIPADHAVGCSAMIFLIRRGGKTLLLGHDTGFLPEKSWDLLRGIELSAAVLESTGSLAVPDLKRGHLGINGTVQFRDRLIESGCISGNTQVVVTHFSHNGHAMHDDLVAAFAAHQITTAYDGMEIEF